MVELQGKAYFYFKSWHIPDVDGIDNTRDKWLLLPANVIVHSGRFHVTALDSRVTSHALMILRDDGLVAIVKRGRPGIKVDAKVMEEIKQQVVDVREWEQVMGTSWPYADMFDMQKVEDRFASKHGNNRAQYYLAPPDLSTYSQIFNLTKVQPCRNCGRRNR